MSLYSLSDYFWHANPGSTISVTYLHFLSYYYASSLLIDLMCLNWKRCYLRCGDIDSAIKMFEEYTSSRFPAAELYVVSYTYVTTNLFIKEF
jgi:pentatricopeptide repeat protein